MYGRSIDFIQGFSKQHRNIESLKLELYHGYPFIDDEQQRKQKSNSILTRDHKNPRQLSKAKNSLSDDGLYIPPDNPLTRNPVKPYYLNDEKTFDYQSKPQLSGRMIEIAVRDVILHKKDNDDSKKENIYIKSIAILYEKNPICRMKHPFDRKLYKLLMTNSDCNRLFFKIYAQDGRSSILPLPLPRRPLENTKINIDFAIRDKFNKIHNGILICTVSSTLYGGQENDIRFHTNMITHSCKPSVDPNDPNNSLTLSRSKNHVSPNKSDKYFHLRDPALTFPIDNNDIALISSQSRREEPKLPDMAIIEEPSFSLLDISFRNLFQINRPLRPSSSGVRRHHTIGKEILTVTILRGVEIPIREESALVQSFVEVEWGSIISATSTADGSAPIWQQTIQLEAPRLSSELDCLKLRLYDQHPVWGRQWLGEARIPLEYHRNYQELERWISLSPLFSPILLFSYLQASPGHSDTRIYILMKFEESGNNKTLDNSAVTKLCKGVQRNLAIPYKINGLENPYEAAKLTMLLPSLSVHYGPLTPRQALNLNKIDHYGRATLLASLFQGFDMSPYVLLGSSQTSKWSAFVLSFNENEQAILWDPEIGESYDLEDSRCPLMKVSRLINHENIWENVQQSILPHNLKYDVKSSKDWRPLCTIVASSSTGSRPIQTLDLENIPEEDNEIQDMAMKIEEHLRNKLSEWRSIVGSTTLFNRHAISLLRNVISKIEDSSKPQLDKKDLKQLYRAYHTHGFILHLRQASIEDITDRLIASKAHDIPGPVEFALVCHAKRYLGRISSLWIGLLILKSRE